MHDIDDSHAKHHLSMHRGVPATATCIDEKLELLIFWGGAAQFKQLDFFMMVMHVRAERSIVHVTMRFSV